MASVSDSHVNSLPAKDLESGWEALKVVARRSQRAREGLQSKGIVDLRIRVVGRISRAGRETL